MNSKSRTIFAALTAGVIVAGPAALAASASEIEQDPTVYATVTGHAPHSPGNNQPEAWCEDGGTKIENPGGHGYVLDADYDQVIVKAGGQNVGPYANTIFGDSPSAGQMVWADTDGDFQYNPGSGGDKEISHIILCDPVIDPPEEGGPSIPVLPIEEIHEGGPSVPPGEVPEEGGPSIPVLPIEEIHEGGPSVPPGEVPEPYQPEQPIEPVEPVEPVEPTEPTVPSQPVVPVEGGQGGGSDEELAFTGLPAGVLALTGLGLVSGGALAMRKANSQ